MMFIREGYPVCKGVCQLGLVATLEPYPAFAPQKCFTEGPSQWEVSWEEFHVLCSGCNLLHGENTTAAL